MPKEIKTKIGPKEWDTIGKAMYSKTSIWIVHFLAIICAYMLIRSYLKGNTAFMGYYILLAAVLEGFTNLARHNQLKAHREFFAQSYGDKELVLTYIFRESSFDTINENTGDKANCSYDKIADYKKTDGYILLRTTERQFFIIDRKAAEDAELIEFLKRRVPELKA